MPVHHEFAERFLLLEGVADFAQFASDPVYAERFRQFGTWDGAAPPVVDSEEAVVPGPHGPVPIRVYGRRPPGSDRPGLVWIHGGGFVSGDLDMPEADWTSREVVARTGAVVISVDYRLAVGGRCHPIPHDDCVAATRWVRDQAAEVGIDASAIALGGASAGANLAAGVTLRLRDDDEWMPRTLVPIYGVFHPTLPPFSNHLDRRLRDLPAAVRIDPEAVDRLNANYVGGPAAGADGYAMPALGALEGMCPVTLINAEYDTLRASGEAFGAALVAAGNDVRQVTAAGMLHAFLNLPARIEPVAGALDVLARTVAGNTI